MQVVQNDCSHPVRQHDERGVPTCGVCGTDLRTVNP